MKSVFLSMRPPFLALTPACIFLGISVSIANTEAVNWHWSGLILLGALAAHISVNTLNEYFDFRSGLDVSTERTPFSGGSGALVENPAAVNSVLFAALASLAVTVGVGLFFLSELGFGLLPLGLVGVAIVLAYTPLINRQPLLCLLAPGIAFGPLMVVGTDYVLSGKYSADSLLASMIPGCLVSNLLLLNQFPDVEADRQVGRRNFPITLGYRRSAHIYGLLLLVAACTLVLGAFAGILPTLSAIALLPMLPAVAVYFGALKNAGDIEKLLPFMAMNVTAAIFTPLVLGFSILVS